MLLSSVMTYDALPLLWETALTANGTATHSTTTSSLSMDVTNAADDKVIRQTKQYFLYRAGQSHLIVTTFDRGEQQTGIRKRVGYFDGSNGIFFESTGEDKAVVIRSSVSGSPVDTRVAQADWNLDKLDGTGKSGATLDLTKSQILIIDLQFLGVGTVRIGFQCGTTNDKIVYVHQFLHSNRINNTYMKTASLPVRYEIETTAGGGSGGKLIQICSAILREGAPEEKGLLTSICTGFTGTATTTSRTLLSVRLRSSHIRAYIHPIDVLIGNISSGQIRFKIIINPTLTGSLSWANNGTASEVSTTQLDYTDGTGHVISSGWVIGTSRTKGTIIQVLDTSLVLAANIAGTSDIISLVVLGDSGSQTVVASIDYLEMY